MNTMLWIALIVSLMGNAVIGYLFWRAIKQNNELEWHMYWKDQEIKFLKAVGK